MHRRDVWFGVLTAEISAMHHSDTLSTIASRSCVRQPFGTKHAGARRETVCLSRRSQQLLRQVGERAFSFVLAPVWDMLSEFSD